MRGLAVWGVSSLFSPLLSQSPWWFILVPLKVLLSRLLLSWNSLVVESLDFLLVLFPSVVGVHLIGNV